MAVVSYPTIEHVAMEARPYPSHLLEGCETGLVLFAAAFLGHNDAIWFVEAGFDYAFCIDSDGERLREMEKLYPPRWGFAVGDAWEYAETMRDMGSKVDVVSCDTWTGDLMFRSLDSLDLWCSLANKVVTVTIVPEDVDELDIPTGWTSSLYPRSETVFWLVLERV